VKRSFLATYFDVNLIRISQVLYTNEGDGTRACFSDECQARKHLDIGMYAQGHYMVEK